MALRRKQRGARSRQSIFCALFVPLFLIMILQSAIFYFATVYGGVEESLTQNAADILSERLFNRKNELETRFNSKWTALDACGLAIQQIYSEYESLHGDAPLAGGSQLQIRFLNDSADVLIDTLRHNGVNGIFLILNDRAARGEFLPGETQQKYGLCIRDMDQDSNYSAREDLLLERAPSSIVDTLDCTLDSWWEAKYSFTSEKNGDYYYYPLNAAWENPGAKGSDLAYCSEAHQISDSDPLVVSYSLPLIDDDGYPYGVLGIEVSIRYLASLLPNKELNDADKCCYVLALSDEKREAFYPVVGTGSLYNRCFGSGDWISAEAVNSTGGFDLTARGNTELYGDTAQLRIYNNNNPFDGRRLTLIAFVESATLFAYCARVKLTLLLAALISLIIGLMGIALVSRFFAAPITALAGRVRGMKAQSDFQLGRLGITEIDQLVDSIEELNRNVSRNSARTEFFSRMSHDMRTPMNAIISFSSKELLEGADEKVKDDYLDKIHASGEYLLALINEVLDMTKIESSRLELHLEPVEALRLLDTTTSIIEKLAQKKKVGFSAQLNIEPGLYVLADRQYINQIVMNLLSNAVKFTSAGGKVRLELATEVEAERERLRIVVSDNGIGMSEEFMKNLYTPFEQENTRREGTGLGLSIAKRLVDLMGGAIECVSRRGSGTVFTVMLPLDHATAALAVPDTDKQAQEPKGFADSLKGRRILICEDNAINTQIICSLLEKMGASVDATADGAAGLRAFAASRVNTYDAVLMDIRMPVMDGLEATRAIRALDREDAATVPVLAMTANAFEEDMRASLDAGMNAHLAKPVEPAKLRDALLEFMK